MDIKRDFYLNKLIERKHDTFVKVITGIRRCGKSYLLNTLFKRHLQESGVAEKHIIEIAMDNVAWAELRDPRKLYEYIAKRVKARTRQYYALIDEIQMCAEVPDGIPGSKGTLTFYDTLNGLMKFSNLDVYVTGSNSKMLSDDVATHFRDRGKIIRLHPLSFSEFLPVSGMDEYRAWEEYLVYGGMPEAVLLKDKTEREEYLSGLFDTLYFMEWQGVEPKS